LSFLEQNYQLNNIFSKPEPILDSTNIYYNSIREFQIWDKKYNSPVDSVLTNIRIYYKNGNKYRVEQFYFENDLLKKIVEFNEFGINGTSKSYYQNGNVYHSSIYENGEQIGPSIYYRENGMIEYMSLNNKFSANALYYENGHIKRLTLPYFCQSDSDSQMGANIQYGFWESGQISFLTIFDAGIQSFKEFYIDGQLSAEGFILNSIWNKVGQWTYYYKNGLKQKELNFLVTTDPNRVNINHGISKFWNKNGKLEREEIYLENKLTKVIEY